MSMKADKARELFSDSFEGTLDPGLRASFQSALDSDHEIRAEYDEFCATMGYLGRLAERSVEVPTFLSDRIATRLEQEMDRKAKSIWSPARWFRTIAMTAAAATVIGGGVYGVLSRGGSVGESNVGPTVSESPGLSVVANHGAVALEFRPAGRQTISISSADGRKLREVEVEGRTLNLPLENPNATTTVFMIEIGGDRAPTYVAVPGSKTVRSASGSGTVVDFAKAVADHYRTPVSVQCASSSKRFDWTLSGSISDSVDRALRGQGLAMTLRRDDLLVISDH